MPSSTCMEHGWGSSVSPLPLPRGKWVDAVVGVAVPLPTLSLLLPLCSSNLVITKSATHRGSILPSGASHSPHRTPTMTGNWRDSRPLGDF